MTSIYDDLISLKKMGNKSHNLGYWDLGFHVFVWGCGAERETIQPITKSIFDLAYVRIPDPKKIADFFKPFIAFVTILFVFYALVFWPRGICDLSFSTGIEPPHWKLKSYPLDCQRSSRFLIYWSRDSFWVFIIWLRTKSQYLFSMSC